MTDAPSPTQDASNAEVLSDVLASLVAAVSILERAHLQKRQPRLVVGSDAMFVQMLEDYTASIKRGRTALRAYARTAPAKLTNAARDVLAERQRQVDVEGWAPEHDDHHGSGELLLAAVCYAQRRMDEDRFGVFEASAPAAWPWDSSSFKPTSRRRDLVKAAALILAEIERIDRGAL